VIDGVVLKTLRLIPDERGYLMECLRSDDEIFEKFGQVYVSAVYKDAVKAWHYHKVQTDFVVCVSGMIKLALYDNRQDSPTYGTVEQIFLGEQNRILVKIPNGVYHGWKGLASPLSLVMNCPDRLYNYQEPDEFRMDPYDNDIPYTWERKDG
jgi:dTDP-4-dehydrorhamnose 3,5-epimerase